VYLPQWSLSDVDLHNWILGFGGQAKVVSPNNFRETLQEKGEAVVKALTTENSNQQ
jgi:predicted DNA-binding transcriptional regulator YafY